MKSIPSFLFKNLAIQYFLFFFLGTSLIFFIEGCATPLRVLDHEVLPSDLYASACGAGKKVESVRGTVWLKTKSKEISGQFAANVVASKPDQLKLEVTNFLGGTEALISVKGEHYSIAGPRGKNDEGYGSWGGIPLKWATELFLGRIPCPDKPNGADRSGEFSLRFGSKGELIVEVSQLKRDPEKYIYEFRSVQGKHWPKSLHWERLSSPVLSVDLNFDDPENETLSPKTWEARSERGAVKVRWRDREVSF